MLWDERTCWICGAKIVESFGLQDTMSGRYCKKHWQEHTAEYKKTVAQYLELKRQVMFERAMRMMERCGVDMTEHKREAKAVQEHSADNPELYKSSDEMVAAVILLKTGVDFEINYKVGRYVVDFYIPDWCVIVEVDGERHEHNHLRDSKRDIELRQSLGDEWEVIRIPTQYIEENPVKLPEAIQALVKQKKELRRKNGGFMPQSYSKREAAYYKDAMVYEEHRVKK